MSPTHDDVQQMVQALFTVAGGLERARKRIPAASRLAVLQLIAAQDKIRPTTIATELGLHQSTITRHIRALEEAGQVILMIDANDRRACTITLTAAGRAEVERLTQIGLDRFAAFVASWEADEVRTLTHLLVKFEESKAKVASQAPRPRGRRWQAKEQ
ncbi:hypothetical protein BH10CHL1_BH10CHL1_50470 [soil metagenome]